MIFNVLMTLKEQKVTIGQSGAGFLLLVFSLLSLLFLASASSRLPVSLLPSFLS